ncbi:helix-hairpin-helix domain-containing protein [Candidatus Daviesbacteria bacterium]|nr:helix-hairpin-helix domain-containing protein [Candidatus Daviesbacteria bacterium]
MLDKFKIPLALAGVGLILIIGGWIFSSTFNKQSENFPKESVVGVQKTISVDVSGAVNNPGVYQLKEGDRVEDAIKAAGGISELASQPYLSKRVNMAQKLSDGMKIYIPMEGETGAIFGVTVDQSAQVNINTASQAELEALPGIGPVTAAKIISDRPYQKIDDLLIRKLVSKTVFEKIKNSISVF